MRKININFVIYDFKLFKDIISLEIKKVDSKKGYYMSTKHDQILNYIHALPIGDKISVRSIAKKLSVSEGTAYRAIKDAENEGIVTTIERVGTVRVEKKNKENIEKLSFAEIVRVIEGDVLSGKAGLNQILNKFVIGAMTEQAMLRYITPNSLMIVGNREEVQRLALENGAAVLITGGFDTSREILDYADEVGMPILRTMYDTFTVATLINRAMRDQMIKKEIMSVEDIYVPLDHTFTLSISDTVENYQSLSKNSGHTRFPIVSKMGRVIGIITGKDVLGKKSEMTLDKIMTRNPNCAKLKMSIASVGHMMIWDGIEMMPVIKNDRSLIGILSRQDVMKAMQISQRQPQISANTISDFIMDELTFDSESIHEELQGLTYHFLVTPQMINYTGTMSIGVLSEVLSNITRQLMSKQLKKNVVIEHINVFYFKMIQLENLVEFKTKILDSGRRSATIEISGFIDTNLVTQAILNCQIMERL